MLSILSIDNSILTIQNKISQFSEKYLFQLENRYDLNEDCSFDDFYKIKKLNVYLDILNKLKEQKFQGSGYCIDESEYNLLVEKIIDITGKECKNLLDSIYIDNSKEDIWAFKNPFCRSYESWEKWSKFFCGQLQMELTLEEEKIPELMLEISREIISPNVLLAITAQKEVKNLNLEISRTVEESKLDFQLLIEELDECDLVETQYVDLVQVQGLSYDMIKVIYESGLSLVTDDKEVYLKTPMNTYKISDLSGKINLKYLEKFGIKPTITKDKLLEDYKI